jgi:hypothetical protein
MEGVSKSVIENGGEVVCTWFVISLFLLPHPDTPPTAAALLIPQNLLTSENRHDNAANYPLVTPKYTTLHPCPSFADDDEENHPATRYIQLIVFSSISELYTECTGRRMGDGIKLEHRLEQNKKNTFVPSLAHTTHNPPMASSTSNHSNEDVYNLQLGSFPVDRSIWRKQRAQRGSGQGTVGHLNVRGWGEG